MADDRTLAYAEALFGVARAEGTLGEVEDELFRFSQTLKGSDELREALTDPAIPVARRHQIVEDLLGGKASSTTVAMISLVVGTGRARDLPAPETTAKTPGLTVGGSSLKQTLPSDARPRTSARA